MFKGENATFQLIWVLFTCSALCLLNSQKFFVKYHEKGAIFHSLSAKVLYSLMIIQAVPLGLKNTNSGRAVTESANIMEELSVGFPHRKGF